MRTALSAFIAGILFGLGLIYSEMVNPLRVKGFLDVSNNWDPTLVFVMGGALLVTTIGYKLVLRRNKPLFEASFSLPTNIRIDKSLISGAILFGIGWGLIGICPGPAIVALATFNIDIVIFVIAMIGGMKFHQFINKK